MNDQSALNNPPPRATQRGRRPGVAGRRLGETVAASRRRLSRPARGPGYRAADGRIALLAVAALLAVFAAMPFDETVMLAARASGWPAVAFMRAITDLGKSVWYLVPAALLFVVSAAADWSLRGIRGKARLARVFGQSAFVFAAVAASGLMADVLKIVFGRSRPRLYATDGAWHFEAFTTGSAHASFPSGHATTIGALTAILFIWFPGYRWLIAPVGLFVASTRIAALAHYPSDVVAGFAFGFLVTLVLARWLAGRGVVFRPAGSSLFPRIRGAA